MAYEVKTKAFYNAALTGAASGMTQGEWPKLTNRLFYDRIVNAAVAVAQAIDTKIGTVVSPNAEQVTLLNALVQSACAGRPSPLHPGSYKSLADAIYAEWTALGLALAR